MQNSHIALLVLLCLAGAIQETEAQYYYYPYTYSYYPYSYYYSYYPYYYTFGKRSIDNNQAPSNFGGNFGQQQGQQPIPQQ